MIHGPHVDARDVHAARHVQAALDMRATSLCAGPSFCVCMHVCAYIFLDCLSIRLPVSLSTVQLCVCVCMGVSATHSSVFACFYHLHSFNFLSLASTLPLLCIYIYTYVYTYVYIHIYTYIYIHTYIHALICSVYIHINRYAARVQKYVHKYLYIYTRIHVHVYMMRISVCNSVTTHHCSLPTPFSLAPPLYFFLSLSVSQFLSLSHALASKP